MTFLALPNEIYLLLFSNNLAVYELVALTQLQLAEQINFSASTENLFNA
jgi:hypothetical protein